MKSSEVLRSEMYSMVEGTLSFIAGRIGRKLRYAYYKNRLRSLGRNVVIDVGVRFINPEHISIGDNCWIDSLVSIIAGAPILLGRQVYRKPNPDYRYSEGEVVIAENCHIAQQVILQGHGGLSIGPNITVASGTKIYTLSHHYRNLNHPGDPTMFKFSTMAPFHEQFLISGPVVMKENSGIGLSSVVFPGVTIHEGTLIEALSLVKHSIPAYAIAGGNPAMVKKERAA